MTKENLLEQATGNLKYSLTNDYLFRALLQKSEESCKGLLCALLHIKPEEITSITITNPITLGEDINAKTCVLDIRIILNGTQLLNIEMQVTNSGDWPERSLFYLCRSFEQIQRGEKYKKIMPTIHIGILDFTLFPDEQEFYSEYLMTNTKTHKIYSDKFSLRVLNLNQLDKLSEEEKQGDLYAWAKFFKATTWEEIRMLAEKNETIKRAATNVLELTADEKIKLQCEARERFERDMASAQGYGFDQGIEQGIEQGIMQGIEQGREQGIEQGREQGIEQGREQGIEQGRELGIEQGVEQGTDRLSKLIQKLLANNQILEINKVTVDAVYREQLLKKYFL